MDFGANHWITAVLLAKRDRWLLWLPVFYGAGIGGTGFAFGAAEKINAGGGEGAARRTGEVVIERTPSTS